MFGIDLIFGIIFVNFVIDRENIFEINFKVVVIDKGNLRKLFIVNVVIIILDVNDNKLRFIDLLFIFIIFEN